MSATAKGERFDKHGRSLEKVTASVSVVGKTVFLHIDGPKLVKSYSFTVEEWAKIVEETSP